MALSTYSELKDAVRTETAYDDGLLSDAAIVDAIKRAEAKINRRTRLRAAETTYEVAMPADRLVSLPSDLVELAWVEFDDGAGFERVRGVDPSEFYRFQGDYSLVYTLRNQIEFSSYQSGTVRLHYFAAFDIATDSTNWVLINYPDAYLYGALAECAMHTRDDPRMWIELFNQVLAELNDLDERSRDVELSPQWFGSSYNVITDS